MENINKDNEISFEPKSKKLLLECKVCGGQANHSNFGAISCDSCKIFFKRNAGNKSTKFQCIFNGNCEINILNRHVCTFCRLKKCFQVGMSTLLFRASRSKKEISNNNQIIQFSTLNLLKLDQSKLSKDEWNLLSNIIHCYDERSTILIGERFISEQNHLPIKLRFKVKSVSQMILLLMSQTQLCLQSNSNFISLISHDQNVFINSTLKHVASIGTAFALGHSELLDQPAFLKPFEMIFKSNLINLTKCLINQLDRDDTFMKLILSIIVFSTINYLNKENFIPINLINLKQILNIQDMYIEVAWKYLVYRYDYYHAIKSFSNIIRVIFISIEGIHQAQQIEVYNDLLDSLIKQTKRTFNIIN